MLSVCELRLYGAYAPIRMVYKIRYDVMNKNKRSKYSQNLINVITLIIAISFARLRQLNL